MASWTCPFCETSMYSAYDAKKREMVKCITCKRKFKNTYYSKLGVKKYTKPGPAKRLARALDKIITIIQEQLEKPECELLNTAAYFIILFASFYFLTHLILLILSKTE